MNIEGVFYSAPDADSEGQEGKYYIWQHNSIIDCLDPEKAQEFIKMYNRRMAIIWMEQPDKKQEKTFFIRVKPYHLVKPGVY